LCDLPQLTNLVPPPSLCASDPTQWDAALAIAELRGHPQTAQLRQQYLDWLDKTQQEVRVCAIIVENFSSFDDSVASVIM
jgi:hypothetical protein